MAGHVLALDQGTTSTRAMVFAADARPVAAAQREFPQHYPRPGWVEHSAEDLWLTTLTTARLALEEAGLEARDIAAIGIANQRETTLLWDRESGHAVHNAIVWQDRRTAAHCAELRADGTEALLTERTGLLADSYFSATKLAWLLDNVPGARAAAQAGRLAFGTVDSFLLSRLTDGALHATDATNASRTMLYDIRRGDWDDDLLRLFRIPRAVLPEVRDSAGPFGVAAARYFGGPVAVCGMAGDQQAALTGQACFQPGMVKSTYGTGCFMLLNTGAQAVASRHRLLTTVACQIGGRRTYALEGAIFVAGAAVQWLRDGLGLVAEAAETGALAAAADPEQPVVLVPAFVGLGAPHWDSEARGALYGLTRGTTRRELARAALESVGYQTRDLLEAMRADAGLAEGTVIRVDGGMTASDWSMQFLADMLGAPVDRPRVAETTALGAAYLAGLEAGVFPEPEAFAALWALDRRFAPAMAEERRAMLYARWQTAVRRTCGR
ncbi:glycerol kinase GlpK [Roseomonas sp. NAR14]|uniref:Glycerol kinase n=1 Tax=Roseomonas acroporae TaxID=2937791 RepID=A0A9X1YBQ6_9PROT|nr:glycerol kinase GlpK [Roseomonas acroporae]MCK8787509.1 glycerol kinase GlpK [Roseomonas acroporae]